jgi:hypothetical protein
MGILWTVYPVTDEMKEYLESENVPYPNSLSNFPTDEQIKLALSQLEDFDIQYSTSNPEKGWGAFIQATKDSENLWANLQVDVKENSQYLRNIWFEKGNEEVIKLFLKYLSKSCGAQVLLADVGGPPEVINA